MKRPFAAVASGLVAAALLLVGCAADGSSGGIKPERQDIVKEMKR